MHQLGYCSAVKETIMPNPSDTMLRNILGPSLQTASMRAILLVAALAFVGSTLMYLLH